MSTVRVVRPRPLGVNDRIPVFWAGQDPPQELKNIDGGALYRHILAADTPTSNRKRKRGERYHAPKEGEALDHFSPLRRAHQQQQQGPGSPIAVPRVREVPDYELNQQAAAHHGPMFHGDINAVPYLRHKELLPGMYDEHHQAEYDADDEDMAFIAGINNPKTPSAAVDRLPLVDFERAMDLLERLHLEAVQEWWAEQQSAGVGPHVPRVPSMKHLLPRSEALTALSGLLPDKKVATQVLEYWLRRRQQEGGPLLSRLWFEQPWKNRRRLNDEDALEALYMLRNELEVVRTLADQVRKREKLKPHAAAGSSSGQSSSELEDAAAEVEPQEQQVAWNEADDDEAEDHNQHTEDDDESDEDFEPAGPRTPRKQPQAAVGGGAAANAGVEPMAHQRNKQQPQQRGQHAGRKADTSAQQTCEVHVLKPHNRQSKQPHRAGSKQVAHAQQKLGSQQAGSKAPCASAAAARAVTASGAAVRPQAARPGSGGRRAVAVSSKHRFRHPRSIGAAELRSLGIVSIVGNHLEAAARSSKRR
eukprot:gene13022-13151_t